MTVTLRDPAHYLKPLKTTSTPKRLLFLDCSSTTNKDKGMWVESWNGAALATTHYTRRKQQRKDTQETQGKPLEMWQAVDQFCRQRRNVLWAYALASQLRISQGLLR